MNDSSILIKRSEDPYARVPKEIVFDRSLSQKARFICTIMCAFPDGGRVTSEKVAEICGLGIVTVRKSIKELKERGYILRLKVRNGASKQIARVDYMFTDKPELLLESLKKPDDNFCRVAPEPGNKNCRSRGEATKKPHDKNCRLGSPGDKNCRVALDSQVADNEKPDSRRQFLSSGPLYNNNSKLNTSLSNASSVGHNQPDPTQPPKLIDVVRFVIDREINLDPWIFHANYQQYDWRRDYGKGSCMLAEWQEVALAWAKKNGGPTDRVIKARCLAEIANDEKSKAGDPVAWQDALAGYIDENPEFRDRLEGIEKFKDVPFSLQSEIKLRCEEQEIQAI